MSLAIGIDVGGTKLLGGVVDDEGRVIARLRRETPREGGKALTHLVDGVGQPTTERCSRRD